MEWVFDILTPALKPEFMVEYLKNIKNIYVYRAQKQGYGHPLQFILSKKMRKEAKPHGENPPSKRTWH